MSVVPFEIVSGPAWSCRRMRDRIKDADSINSLLSNPVLILARRAESKKCRPRIGEETMGLLQIASLVVVAASLWLIFLASRDRSFTGRLPTSDTDRKTFGHG
jgi:hypothetical protein